MRWDDSRGHYVLTGTGRSRISTRSRELSDAEDSLAQMLDLVGARGEGLERVEREAGIVLKGVAVGRVEAGEARRRQHVAPRLPLRPHNKCYYKNPLFLRLMIGLLFMNWRRGGRDVDRLDP